MAKILVVDDSETLVDQLKKLLQGAGHIVVTANDGSRGLMELEKHSDIKLVLCDVNMPVMDGITMCTKVAMNPAWKGIPILMLTTEASPALKERGKAVGVRAWIMKPHDDAKLLAAVVKLTQG